ncbi:MAG: DoxX family membrane protein [Parcubacteria group bacterium]|nr:DoxX family membrane protein [Parcubacteria group bacterium]
MSERKIAIFLLRLGLAFVFFYAAIFSFLNPNDWIGFFPIFIRDILSVQFLLITFSFYELILGFWLISGKWQFYAGLISAATLLGIIIFNFGAFDIVFRDVGLFFASLAFVFLSRQTNLIQSD